MAHTYETFIKRKFHAKSLQTIQMAREIIDEYAAQNFTLTLRQLYYQFVARGLRENSDASYKSLGKIIARGREAGLLPWDGIEDRNRDTTIWRIDEDESSALHGIETRFAMDFWTPQDAYIEVWVEKDALTSVIERPCGALRVPYMACKGFLSASEAWRAGKRFQRALAQGKQAVLIHLGDHDPSGIDMTRDNDERLEMFARSNGVDVRRIALNRDQIDQYDPPPNPTKKTDSRSKKYLEEHGKTSWELDALSPQVIYDLITDTVNEYIDEDIWSKVAAKEERGRRLLSALTDEWDGYVRELVDAIHYEDLGEELLNALEKIRTEDLTDDQS